MCICVFLTFLHVFKWGSIAQVSTSWTSQARRATVSVENYCMHLCALGVCEFVHVIALLVMQSARGYMALSLGNNCGDSRPSDETNGLLPNNKLILYGKVSRSWLDVNYLLIQVNTCTHVYHYTHITYHTCTCIFTHNTHTRTYTKHTATHTDDCSVKCDEPKS